MPLNTFSFADIVDGLRQGHFENLQMFYLATLWTGVYYYFDMMLSAFGCALLVGVCLYNLLVVVNVKHKSFTHVSVLRLIITTIFVIFLSSVQTGGLSGMNE